MRREVDLALLRVLFLAIDSIEAWPGIVQIVESHGRTASELRELRDVVVAGRGCGE